MIYFIERLDTGHIKIGTTIRLSQRLKQLAKQCGSELRLLAVIDGRYEVERDLHRRFSSLCAKNEWFEPGDDLLDFIRGGCRAWDGSDDDPLAPVKMDAEVIRKGKIVASYRGQSLAEFLSEELGAIIDRLLEEEHAKEVTRGPKPKGKGAK